LLAKKALAPYTQKGLDLQERILRPKPK